MEINLVLTLHYIQPIIKYTMGNYKIFPHTNFPRPYTKMDTWLSNFMFAQWQRCYWWQWNKNIECRWPPMVHCSQHSIKMAFLGGYTHYGNKRYRTASTAQLMSSKKLLSTHKKIATGSLMYSLLFTPFCLFLKRCIIEISACRSTFTEHVKQIIFKK